MSRFLSIRCLIIIIVSMLTSAAFACPHIVTANGINKPSVIHINEPVTFSIGSAVCDRCFIPSNGYSWTVEDATIIGSSTGSSVACKFGSSGWKLVKVRAHCDAGFVSNYVTVMVRVLPEIEIMADKNLLQFPHKHWGTAPVKLQVELSDYETTIHAVQWDFVGSDQGCGKCAFDVRGYPSNDALLLWATLDTTDNGCLQYVKTVKVQATVNIVTHAGTQPVTTTQEIAIKEHGGFGILVNTLPYPTFAAQEEVNAVPVGTSVNFGVSDYNWCGLTMAPGIYPCVCRGYDIFPGGCSPYVEGDHWKWQWRRVDIPDQSYAAIGSGYFVTESFNDAGRVEIKVDQGFEEGQMVCGYQTTKTIDVVDIVDISAGSPHSDACGGSVNLTATIVPTGRTIVWRILHTSPGISAYLSRRTGASVRLYYTSSESGSITVRASDSVLASAYEDITLNVPAAPRTSDCYTCSESLEGIDSPSVADTKEMVTFTAIPDYDERCRLKWSAPESSNPFDEGVTYQTSWSEPGIYEVTVYNPFASAPSSDYYQGYDYDSDSWPVMLPDYNVNRYMTKTIEVHGYGSLSFCPPFIDIADLPGETYATLSGMGEETLTWSIVGGNVEGITIDADGHITADETASAGWITVRAQTAVSYAEADLKITDSRDEDATVVYVDDDADPNVADGQGWSTAYTYLQDALTAASPGSEIRIAGGIYKPDQRADTPGGTGVRNDSFVFKDRQTIRGGYAGLDDMSDPSRQSVDDYETILSGDINVQKQPEDNSYNVLTCIDVDGVILEGLTVQDGYAAGVDPSQNGGGLLFFSYMNSANCEYTANLTVRDCVFKNNFSSENGAGLYINDAGDVTFEHVIVQNNHAVIGGGGLYVYSYGLLQIDGCQFEGNTAEQGGALYAKLSEGQIIDARFSENTASYGGAIFSLENQFVYENCTLSGNSADYYGGAVYFERHKASENIRHCTFEENTAQEGGAVYNLQGSFNESCLLVLFDSLFRNNTSQSMGGAILNNRCILDILNCTVADNNVSNAYGFGAGLAMLNNASYVTVENSILWGNTIAGQSFPYAQIAKAPGADGTISLSHCCVDDGQPDGSIPWAGQGNIDSDPLFVSGPMGDNYLAHLVTGHAADSPCIDAGMASSSTQELNVRTTRIDHIVDKEMVYLGAQFTAGQDPLYYEGLLDEVRIIDQSLSPEEVSHLAETNLQAYWGMDDDDISGDQVYDSSGNNYTGTIFGNPQSVDGYIGQARKFDGVYDFISMGDIDDLEGLSQMTMSVWIYLPPEDTFHTRVIFSKYETYWLTLWGFPQVNLYLPGFIMWEADGIQHSAMNGYSSDIGRMVTGRWYHLAITLDEPVLKMFVDGVQIDETTIENPQSTSWPLVLGAFSESESSTEKFDGIMDEVRFYDRALDAGELQELANITKPIGNAWRMNGDLENAAESGYIGTAYGNPQYVDGRCGDALQFNGTTDYVKIGGYDGVKAGDSRTCAAWINTTAAGNLPIMSWGTYTANAGEKWGVFLDDGRLKLDVAGGAAVADTALLNDGQWHHVAVTLDDDGTANLNEAVLYVDGIECTLVGTPADISLDTGGTKRVDIGYHYKAQKPYYVDITSTAINPEGASWDDAFRYLQDALAVAEPGDRILVAQGTYHPDEYATVVTGDVTESFVLKDGVIIQGGYAGLSGAIPYLRDTEAFETILSGDLGASGNVYHVISAIDVSMTRLDGVTITQGQATGASEDMYDLGGGLYSLDSSVDVRNCTFHDNQALTNGGGIYSEQSTLTITNCLLYDNHVTAGNGGAVTVLDNSELKVINATITENAAANGFAGGINADSSGVRIVNSILWNNTDISGLNQASQITYADSVVAVKYCCVQDDNSDDEIIPFAGDYPGNIDDSPIFEDASANNYRLALLSPCIEAGSCNPVDGILRTDITSVSLRCLDGDHNGSSVIDMGAFEFKSPSEPYILLSQNTFNFYGHQGYNGYDAVYPPTQELRIRNLGTTTLNWQIVNIPDWMKIRIVESQTDTEEDIIYLGVNILGQATGNYSGTLMVTGDDTLNNPEITVNLHIGGIYRVPSQYPTIQNAIDICQDGDMVLVEDGIHAGTGFRDVDFQGKAIIVKSENGPENCIIDCQGTYSEEHRAFIFENDENENSVLAGFTIRNGSMQGGAVYCSYSGPRIQDCVFEMCGKSDANGGAIYCSYSTTTISDCTFNNDFAYCGGAVYAAYSDITVQACKFQQNQAVAGGAIYADRCDHFVLDGCNVKTNISEEGSGLNLYYVTGYEVRNTVFDDNFTFGDGAAAYIRFGMGDIINCTFVNNRINYPGGTVLHLEGCETTISSCMFWDSLDVDGDEIYVVGAISTITSIDYCNIEGGQDAIDDVGEMVVWGDYNINDDPLFIDRYHLTADSPCRNAGDPSGDCMGEMDIDGQPRVFDGRVDIGADEYVTQTWYVNDLTGDDDNNNGLTPQTPFKTIQHGIDSALELDTIIVYPGTYAPIDFSGKAVTVQSTDPGNWHVVADTIIDGTGENNVVGCFNAETSHTILNGFTIGGSTGAAVSCSYASPTIQRCIIEDASDGVTSYAGSPKVSSCILRNLEGTGVSVLGSDVVIENCLIYNMQTGIWLGYLPASVRNNTIVACDYGITWTAGKTVTNCIFWNNNIDDLVNCNAVYSCVENGDDCGVNGNICIEPKFAYVDEVAGIFDYHLSASSPCIDQGDANSVYPEHDLDGNQRVTNGRIDMGAYEYQGNVERPIAYNQTVKVTAGMKEDIILSADPQGANLTYKVIQGPSHGSYVQGTGLEIDYTMSPGFDTDAIMWRVKDQDTGLTGNTAVLTLKADTADYQAPSIESVEALPSQTINLSETNTVTLIAEYQKGTSSFVNADWVFSDGPVEPNMAALIAPPLTCKAAVEFSQTGSYEFVFELDDNVSDGASMPITINVVDNGDDGVTAPDIEHSTNPGVAISIDFEQEGVIDYVPGPQPLSYEIQESDDFNGTLSGSAPQLTYECYTTCTDTFTYTVTDGIFTATGTVTLHVVPFGYNEAPVPDAGEDIELTLPNPAFLAGTIVEDDGMPLNTPLEIEWSAISYRLHEGVALDPNHPLLQEVDFDISTDEIEHTSDILNPIVGFPLKGIYILQLRLFDGELEGTDTLTVTVRPAYIVVGGEDHSFMLKNDETVWAFGRNDYGQLGCGRVGSGYALEVTMPYRVLGGEMSSVDGYLYDVRDIDAGWFHSIACDWHQEGNVWTWGFDHQRITDFGRSDYGYNGPGILGVNTQANYNSDDWYQKFVSGDDGYEACRLEPIKVLSGEQGHNPDNHLQNPDTYLENIIQVSAGRSGTHCLAVEKLNLDDATSPDKGYVWSWGSNYAGQLGNGLIEGDMIDALQYYIKFTSQWLVEDEDGKLWLDFPESSELEDPETYAPREYPGYEDAPVQVLSGEQAELLTGVSFDPNNPTPLQNIIDVSGGAFHSIALEKRRVGCIDETHVLAWGANWAQSAVGYYVDEDGDGLYEWNEFYYYVGYGFLGNGEDDSVDHSVLPVYVHGGKQAELYGQGPDSLLTNIRAISAAWYHNMALENLDSSDPEGNSKGRVYTWGSNLYGYEKPLAFSDASEYTPKGVKMYCDGGRLGVGYDYDENGIDLDECVSEPVCVFAGEQATIDAYINDADYTGNYLENIVQIGGGESHSIALEKLDFTGQDPKSKGRVYTWGSNVLGQLGIGVFGDGTNPNASIPTPKLVIKEFDEQGNPIYLDNIVAIDTGYWHCLAVDVDGNVWAWGLGYEGALGTGKSYQCYSYSYDDRGTYCEPLPVKVMQTPRVFNTRTGQWYLEIQPAINAAQSNDIIKVAEGDYLGFQVPEDKEGLTIQSMHPHDPGAVNRTRIIKGMFDPEDYVSCLIKIEGALTTLNGFTIDGNDAYTFFDYWDGYEKTADADHGITLHVDGSVNVQNCVIQNAGNGIYCKGTTSATIRNNTILECSQNGIECYNTGASVIRDNTIWNCGCGIRCLSTSSPTLEFNNIENCSKGIDLSGFNSSPQVKSNKLFNNRIGIYAISGTPTIINNVLLYTKTQPSADYGLYTTSSLSLDSVIRNNTISYVSGCDLFRSGRNWEPFTDAPVLYNMILGGTNPFYAGSGLNNTADNYLVEYSYIADDSLLGTDLNNQYSAAGPAFTEDGYHLSADAVYCINLGDLNRTYPADEEDIDGRPRVPDGAIDIGAHEYIDNDPPIINFAGQVESLEEHATFAIAYLELDIADDYYPNGQGQLSVQWRLSPQSPSQEDVTFLLTQDPVDYSQIQDSIFYLEGVQFHEGTEYFYNEHTPTTVIVQFEKGGEYVLEVKVSDGLSTVSQQTNAIIVDCINAPPVVTIAGKSKITVSPYQEITLYGSFEDDGLEVPEEQCYLVWEIYPHANAEPDAYGRYGFSEDLDSGIFDCELEVEFYASGDYTVVFWVWDYGQDSWGYDTVDIHVEDSFDNQPPTGSVEWDSPVYININPALDYSVNVTDITLPYGSLEYNWYIEDDDPNVLISDTSEEHPDITFTKTGTYTLNLHVDDGQYYTILSFNDIVVTSVILPPIVEFDEASTDTSGSIADEFDVVATITDNCYPTGSTVVLNYQWTVGTVGDGSMVFDSNEYSGSINYICGDAPVELSEIATFTKSGEYTIRLRVVKSIDGVDYPPVEDTMRITVKSDLNVSLDSPDEISLSSDFSADPLLVLAGTFNDQIAGAVDYESCWYVLDFPHLNYMDFVDGFYQYWDVYDQSGIIISDNNNLITVPDGIEIDDNIDDYALEVTGTSSGAASAEVSFKFPGEYLIMYCVKAKDGQGDLIEIDADYLAVTVETENSTEAETVPYATSFGEFEGIAPDILPLDFYSNPMGWKLESGFAQIRTPFKYNGEYEDSLRVLWMTPQSAVSKEFDGNGINDTNIRMEIRPRPGTQISLCNDNDEMIAGVRFLQTDAESIAIQIYDENDIGQQLQPEFTYNINDWLNLKFEMDYSSGQYTVYCTQSGSDDLALIGSIEMPSGVDHDSLGRLRIYSGYGRTQIYRLSVDGLNNFDYYSKDWEPEAGVDCEITYPGGDPGTVEVLQGNIEILGHIMEPDLHAYRLRYIPIDQFVETAIYPNMPIDDLNAELANNWPIAWAGSHNVAPGGILGYWDTSVIPNGFYHLGIEIWRDGFTYIMGNYVPQSQVQMFIQTKELQQVNGDNQWEKIERETVYSVTSDLKCNTFTHSEEPDISVPWPGQIPFMLMRVYNNNKRNDKLLLQPGWNFNMEIKLQEDTKNFYEPQADSIYPDYDDNNIAFGYIWVILPDGSQRMFRHLTGYVGDHEDYYNQQNKLAYSYYCPYPDINNGDYIERVTSLNSTGDAVDYLAYTLRTRDGSEFIFNCDDPPTRMYEVDMDGDSNPDINIYGNQRMLANPITITDRFFNTLNFEWQDSDADGCKDALEHIYFTNNVDGVDTYTIMDFILSSGKYSRIQLRVSPDLTDIDGTSCPADTTIYQTIEFGLASPSDVNDIPGTSESEDLYSITDAYRVVRSGWTYDPASEGMIEKEYVTHYCYDAGGNMRQISRGENDGANDVVLPVIKVDYDDYGRVISRYDFIDGNSLSGYQYIRTDYDYLFIPEDQTQSDSPTYLETVMTLIFDDTQDGLFGQITKREALAVQDAYGNMIRRATYLYTTTVEAGTDIQSLYDDTAIEWTLLNGEVNDPDNNLTKTITMEYESENNPCRPSAMTEFFDGQARRTEFIYDENSPYDLLEKRVYIDNQLNYFTLEFYDYHSLYRFPTGQTTWQDFCQEDQHNGNRVQSISIYGDADGTEDPAVGKYLVKKKVLLDPDNMDSDDGWLIAGYTYYANGQINTITDPEGAQTQTVYDEYGYPAYQIALAVGTDQEDIVTNRTLHDSIGRPVLETTQRGAVTLNDYDDFGRIYRVRIYADCTATTRDDFERTTYEAMTPETDSIKAYDAFGRTVFETQQVTGYDTAAFTQTVYMINGQPKLVEQYGYSTSISDYELASQTFYIYDGMTGQKIAEHIYDATQPQGYDDKWTTFTYDALGQLIETTWYDFMRDADPAWDDTDIEDTVTNAVVVKRMTTDYYASGKKKAEKLFSGPDAADLEKHASYEYDILDKMIRSTVHMDDPADDFVTRYGHNALGKLIYEIDPEGNCIFTDYDNANREIFGYFAVPAVDVVWDGADPNYAATYDLRIGRQYTEYNRNGQIKSITSYDCGDTDTDNIGDTILSYTEFEYDQMRRLTAVFEATEQTAGTGEFVGATTTYAYMDSDASAFSGGFDEYDVCITDGEYKKTWIMLDEFDNRIKIRYPSGVDDQERYAYYGDGSLKTKYVWHDDDGDQVYQEVAIGFSYDTFGRLDTITYPAPEAGTIVYTYTGLGQATSITDSRSGNSYAYTYDVLGRTETVTDQDDYSTVYMYTVDGQKKAIQVFDDTPMEIYHAAYDYDEALRLQTIAKGPAANDLIAGFTYTSNGSRNTLTYYRGGTLAGDVTSLNYVYNADNRLTNYYVSGGPTFTFAAAVPNGIDGLGRLTSCLEIVPQLGANVSAFSYDLRGQLATAAKSNIGGAQWSRSYTYDLAGNIDEKEDTQTSEITDYSYTGDLMFGWQVDADPPVTLDWDPYNGRLTQSETAQLEYGLNGRLTAATAGTDSITMEYDPAGNRVYKSSDDGVTTTETKYVIDMVGDLPVILLEIDDTDGSLIKSYYYAHAQPLAQADHTDPDGDSIYDDVYFYLHDRLGSVRLVIDEDAAVMSSYTYDPFGEILQENQAANAPTNAFLFAGQWYDTEIGQYCLRARMYDPALMRFTTRDPYGGEFTEPMTLHRYLYCANDPINRIDFSGQSFVDINFTYTPIGIVAGALRGGIYGFGCTGTPLGVAIGSGVGMVVGSMGAVGGAYYDWGTQKAHAYVGFQFSTALTPQATITIAANLNPDMHIARGFHIATSVWDAAGKYVQHSWNLNTGDYSNEYGRTWAFGSGSTWQYHIPGMSISFYYVGEGIDIPLPSFGGWGLPAGGFNPYENMDLIDRAILWQQMREDTGALIQQYGPVSGIGYLTMYGLMTEQLMEGAS